jgi:uncharacterized protein (TIGR02186 family)
LTLPRRAALALLCALLWPLAAAAENVVLGLSQTQVSITTNFAGDDILIFGAIKREEPLQETPLSVIVTVEGPAAPVTVRKKDRRFGIWINTEAATVDSAPSFYAVSSSGPLDAVLRDTEDLRHRITINRAIRIVGESEVVADPAAFTEALIRIRKAEGAYQMRESSIDLREQTLFRTALELPANLTEGDYRIRTFLTRDGAIVSQHAETINVRKVGLERWLFSLSREQPLAYGLMSLAIAIAAGWAASAVFRLFRAG